MTEERSYLSALDSKQFNARVMGQMKRRREMLKRSERVKRWKCKSLPKARKISSRLRGERL